LPQIIAAMGIPGVDILLADLGMSSMQIDDPARGFSVKHEGPLDMRMNPQRGQPVSAFLKKISSRALATLLVENADEPHATVIAPALAGKDFATTTALAAAIRAALPRLNKEDASLSIRRVFQALRIAVNDELGSLEAALPAAIELLRPGGRLAVISFHSLEDRIVKQTFQREERGCICPPELPECVCGLSPRLRIVTRHPLTAREAEIAANPRSRSAKLRVAEKVEAESRQAK